MAYQFTAEEIQALKDERDLCPEGDAPHKKDIGL